MVGLAVSPADRLHVAVQLRQRTAYRPLPETEGGERWSRAVNAGNILLNLTILGVFKYYDFFAASFAELFGIADYDSLLLRIILPVGISFYTFQALSYSIDVYREKLAPTRDIVAFFAFISFFPQLVAGPIERATNLLPQFLRPRTFDTAQAVDGLRQALWGFFKKIVVADNCAILANGIFDNYENLSGGALVIGAVAFSFQIYGDFSGYSDIAIGISRLFGFSLMRNFNYPYFSRDIAEFWRRWHISLTTWFRDYIYIPLGGSRGSKWMVFRNTLVIFLVSGFWHGANWTFIAWGAYHALLFLPLILSGRNRRYTGEIAAGRTLPTARRPCKSHRPSRWRPWDGSSSAPRPSATLGATCGESSRRRYSTAWRSAAATSRPASMPPSGWRSCWRSNGASGPANTDSS